MPDRQQPARSAETEASLHDQVRREQARLLLDRARLPNLMTLPASLLVAWVLWPYVEHAVVLGWLAAKLLVGAIRFFIDRRAMREGPSRVTFWGARYEVAMAADGVLFGMLGTLLLPPGQPLVSVAMAATVLGIAAISGVVFSSNWRACVAYTLPLMVPATVLQLLQGERIPTFFGLGMTLFLVLLVLEVRKATAHTQAMLRLRFQVDDLGAQRQAALELAERSNAAKSQFLATISHEMRTPLHVTLERTGDHLLGIINDVLDYSKIESGHLRLVEQDFELGAVLRSLHTLTQVSAQERGLKLHLESLLPVPCWVRGDEVRLRQVLLNLVGNAIKFTEVGQVTLRAQPLVRAQPGLGCR